MLILILRCFLTHSKMWLEKRLNDCISAKDVIVVSLREHHLPLPLQKEGFNSRFVLLSGAFWSTLEVRKIYRLCSMDSRSVKQWLYLSHGRQWEAEQPFWRKPPGCTRSLHRAVQPGRSKGCAELSRAKPTA